ncbi:acyl-CoA thioesterase [Parapedobacter sp. DT-150]|uniref:acyl-CoA thioesterase n=1 Tax=Parapedobacter sp. DT-150 TaxID=3396162 RepID=UPI003F19A041
MSNIENLASFNYATPVEIRFADMDAFGHVNNAVYLTYFEVARSHYWREVIQWDWKSVGIIIARAEVDYLRQLTVRDTAKAYVRTSRVGNASFDVVYALVTVAKDGTETLTARGMTVCVAFDYATQKPTGIPTAQRQAMERDLNP